MAMSEISEENQERSGCLSGSVSSDFASQKWFRTD